MGEEPRSRGNATLSGAGSEAGARPEAVAIERLFREHNDSLLRYLAARLGSYQEAKEVAQESYVRLLKLDSPGAVSYLRAFLFKTASNLAIDRLRARRYRERPASLEFFESVPDACTPEREVGGVQEIALLSQLLQQLPAKCRYAFVENKFHGSEPSVIAKELGVSVRMVRNYIERALVHCGEGLDGAQWAVRDGEGHERE